MSEATSNRTVLVTGASRGIGAAIADTFAGLGAQVYGTATTADGADAITARLQAISGSCQGRVLNVNAPEQVNALVKEITAEAGAPQVLVNNAGMTRDGLLLRMGEDDWSDVMDTNLRSVYRLSKACLRGMMKARFGRIINIASVVGATGNPGQTNYSAAKAGMVGFSKSLAQEVASRGITINVIAPGFIDTDMTRKLDDKQRESLMQGIPIGRLGSGQDIADTVVFLASENAGYITGQTIHVNGGMYMN